MNEQIQFPIFEASQLFQCWKYRSCVHEDFCCPWGIPSPSYFLPIELGHPVYNELMYKMYSKILGTYYDWVLCCEHIHIHMKSMDIRGERLFNEKMSLFNGTPLNTLRAWCDPWWLITLSTHAPASFIKLHVIRMFAYSLYYSIKRAWRKLNFKNLFSRTNNAAWRTYEIIIPWKLFHSRYRHLNL